MACRHVNSSKFQFGLVEIFVLVALVALVISGLQSDGLVHLVFFDGASGLAIWLVVLPISSGIYLRIRRFYSWIETLCAVYFIGLALSTVYFSMMVAPWQFYSGFVIPRALLSPLIPVAVLAILLPLLERIDELRT